MKLSKIKYSDIVLKTSFDDLEKIVFYEENNEDEKCDIGIVFGGVSMIPYRTDKAIELYEKDKINKILVTGGIGFLNTDRKTPEAFKMKNYLIDRGISTNDILTETNSKNSFENIKYSLEILKEHYNMSNTKLALITSDFHLKRCFNLVAQQYNKDYLVGYASKDGKTDIDSYKKTLYGKRLILQEALLLCYYAKMKKIDDLNIKGLSLEK